MSNEEPEMPKRAICHTCEERREIKHHAVLYDFCSDECFNKYLRMEGFHHRYKNGVQVVVGEGNE